MRNAVSRYRGVSKKRLTEVSDRDSRCGYYLHLRPRRRAPLLVFPSNCILERVVIYLLKPVQANRGSWVYQNRRVAQVSRSRSCWLRLGLGGGRDGLQDILAVDCE